MVHIKHKLPRKNELHPSPEMSIGDRNASFPLVYYSLDPARKFQQDETHKTQPAFYKAFSSYNFFEARFEKLMNTTSYIHSITHWEG
jgi:hypothetical protein